VKRCSWRWSGGRGESACTATPQGSEITHAGAVGQAIAAANYAVHAGIKELS